MGRVNCGRVGGRTIIVIPTDDQLLDLSKATHLAPNILVKCVEVVLQLLRVHLALVVVCWILVHIWHEDRLRVGWLDVFSTAAVSVSACADLVVETAVHFILLGTEDGGEEVRHFGGTMEGGKEIGARGRW